MPLLTIKDYIDDTDLRRLNWQNATLRRQVNTYKIVSGECVIFENKAKNRARAVANLGGMPTLLIFPIDPKRQLTTHLEVNIALRRMDGAKEILLNLDGHVESIKDRLAHRKTLIAAAAKRRRDQRGG
jgi:hypothetical protein